MLRYVSLHHEWPDKHRRNCLSDILNLTEGFRYSLMMTFKLFILFLKDIMDILEDQELSGKTVSKSEHWVERVSERIKHFDYLSNELVLEFDILRSQGVLLIFSYFRVLADPHFGLVKSIEEDHIGRRSKVAELVVEYFEGFEYMHEQSVAGC